MQVVAERVDTPDVVLDLVDLAEVETVVHKLLEAPELII
jgi:hypothetical protein